VDKKFIGILLVIVLAFAGYFFVAKKDESSTTNTNSSAKVSNHAYGAGSGGVTIVEYADFECPACGSFYPLVEEVRKKYGDQITYVFKNFPLDTIHLNARAAHRAAEAAHNQGKHLEMYNLLYENQSTWKDSRQIKETMDSYAQSLGLDLTRFSSEFASEATNELINADITEGKSLGVNATPTFFINGEQVSNDDLRSIEQFSKVIDDLIAKNGSSATEPTTSEQPAQ
jgi:protein-disulfide isomerase